MKKPLILAALSGLILVGAAYPDFDKPDDDQDVAAASDGGQHYRPCRSRRDDRCIQLYERGVRTAYARWLRDGDPGYDEAVRYAVYEDGADRRAGMRRGHRDRFAERGPDRGHRGMGGPGHGREHARHHARLAMVDVLRCEDRGAPRRIANPRGPRPAVRPAPRPRMYEDSGVRGM